MDVGTWWGAEKEIDVVALNERGQTVLAGSCKWTNEPMDVGEYADLQQALAGAAPAHPQTGPLPGAYHRALLPELERKLERGDYSLRDLEAAIVELDPGELANINTEADLRRVELR